MAGIVRKLMQSFGTGLSVGWTSGLAAARRVYEDSGDSQQRDWMTQQSVYALLWMYFSNELFERFSSLGYSQVWNQYKSNYNLYRNIRALYNPTRRLVNFYAGQVYPGVLPVNDEEIPDGISEAIPLGKDTSDTLKVAIRQFWQWSNWQAQKAVMVRYGAIFGSVLVEVVDDVEHRKVTGNVVKPSIVPEIVLDSAGNVKYYSMEYQSYDEEQNQYYVFRKEVDRDIIRYYRDGQPYNYGDGATVPNPYGFVPAVWAKHFDVGGQIGSPTIAGSIPKIDELNGLASHLNDQIHKVVGAPAVLWSSGGVKNLFSQEKRVGTEDLPTPASDQESILLLRGPADGHVDSLAGNLDIPGTIAAMQMALEEIEHDLPELTVFEELRQMTQLTGPAAERLVAPAISRLVEASGNYDLQSVKLFQMALAIAGERANSGAWGPSLNRQQQKFTSFNLTSYQRGNLDFVITPRTLLRPTGYELALEKQAYWTGIKTGVDAGVPLEVLLKEEGWSDERLAELGQAKLDAIKRQQTLMQADTIPPFNQRGQPNIPPSQQQQRGGQANGQTQTRAAGRQTAP